MKDWKARAAKRIVAENTLRAACEQILKAREGGGERTSSSFGSHCYAIAGYLARHAAEQLRLSEGGE